MSLVYRRRNRGWERLGAFIQIQMLAGVTQSLRRHFPSNKAICILELTSDTGLPWLLGCTGRLPCGLALHWPGVLSGCTVTSQGFCLSPATLRRPGLPPWQAPRKNDGTEKQTHPELPVTGPRGQLPWRNLADA